MSSWTLLTVALSIAIVVASSKHASKSKSKEDFVDPNLLRNPFPEFDSLRKKLPKNCFAVFKELDPRGGILSIPNHVSVGFNVVKSSKEYATFHKNKSILAAKLLVKKSFQNISWKPTSPKLDVNVLTVKPFPPAVGKKIESTPVTVSGFRSFTFNVTANTANWLKKTIQAHVGLALTVTDPRSGALNDPYKFGLTPLGLIPTTAYAYVAIYKEYSQRCTSTT